MSERPVEKIVAGWSAPNRERASTLLAVYPERRSAVMPLLYLAVLEHGHVTDTAMHEVAELTGMTAAQVQSVASFYTMYKRSSVGRYLVSVCTSISCYLMGGDEVLAAIEDGTGALDGETSEDGLFSVDPGAGPGSRAALFRHGSRPRSGTGPGRAAPHRNESRKMSARSQPGRFRPLWPGAIASGVGLPLFS